MLAPVSPVESLLAPPVPKYPVLIPLPPRAPYLIVPVNASTHAPGRARLQG